MDNSKLIAHYQKLLSEYGNDARSLQHFDKKSQLKRFEVLSSYILEPNFSILDIGCGLGHLHSYLENYHSDFTYHGIDIVPEFILNCREIFHGKHSTSFSETNILNSTEGLPRKQFDYVIICGIFNNKLENNWDFLAETITQAFDLTTKTLSFNLLSTYVDHQNGELYYVDPCVVFDFCKRKLSRKVSLQHDYLVKENSIPYEYTLHVSK